MNLRRPAQPLQNRLAPAPTRDCDEAFTHPAALQAARLLNHESQPVETDPAQRAAAALEALSSTLAAADATQDRLPLREITAFLDITVRTLRSGQIR